MKPEPDPQLDALLRSWKAEIQPHSGFSRDVWERIATAEERSYGFRRFWTPIESALARPAGAFLLIFLFIASGFFLSNRQVQHLAAYERAQIESRYFTSIDPVALAQERHRP